MAFEQGTATDYIDLLDKLKNFCTGANSPTSGLNWVVEREVTYSPLEKEIIFRGTGGVSPENSIYWGIKTYSNTGLGRYNWDLRGMTGFLDGSPTGSQTFETQPGVSPASTYIPLENAAMDYWFYGTDRRIIMVANTSVSYQFMYAGFFNAFATEVEYPYPMVVIGATYNVDQKFNDNAVGYGTVPRPITPSNGSPLSSIQFRFIDGSWYNIASYNAQSGNEADESVNDRPLWPLHDDGGITLATGALMYQGTYNFDAFTDDAAGGTPTRRLLRGFGSPQPHPLFPLTMLMFNPTRQYLGELDGVYWVPATGGLTSEDQIIDTLVSPERNYDVFQNTHKTDDWQFYAVKREL